MARQSRGKRSGGRAGNARRSGPAIKQMDWSIPVNSDMPTTPLPPEGVEAMHDGAMRILEEIGIEFLNEEAAQILKKAGCTLNDTNVRMDREFVMEKIALAPSQFKITPRNPDRSVADIWYLAMSPAHQIARIWIVDGGRGIGLHFRIF